jgi:Na+-transporting methylmalonyl-CoA/oxaloacetate decarboxylase gamma subunit
MSWSVFLGVSAVLLFFAFLVWLGGRADDRRWQRQREAEDAARRAAE